MSDTVIVNGLELADSANDAACLVLLLQCAAVRVDPDFPVATFALHNAEGDVVASWNGVGWTAHRALGACELSTLLFFVAFTSPSGERRVVPIEIFV